MVVRLFGCGLLALTFASTGWAAEHYVEVWNPPEARQPAARTPAARTGADARAGKSVEKHANATPKAAVKPHKRRVAQAVKAGSHRPPATAAETPAAPRPVAQPAPGRLTVMQPAAPDAQHALNYSDIPRQYTPDGNVLRVGTHNRSAEVTR
ncbi:hypothetical protein [Burkholderia cepacia]|uniref:Uncharacterized protein n=1 Tax=Burkholderia cepacia TaxID=292 RepID=A0ABN5CXK9_BURCE|nr:hypothetical protein [Burkholderia cepacia]AIO24211.1 hypothetical protein DM41_1039 [Burkholderia cepacia ATCC 25416]ALK16831.1 hypothetical protein APZ15_02830 [Burkholderia cepacia ATCC 25416]ASE94552.1 hypothetical protein CEQ23_13670 [Burkholderia cepacia]ATF77272.1 hypothetical protein CO711_07315 [Burkholderia cepacia]KVU62369.1 hypothetical protein WK70_05675 [Burkholderia cepacia]